MKDFSDLLSQLHEQYAQNDNSHKSTFVSLLVALFALFGAYGYFYANVNVSTGGIYTMENLLLLAGFVCLVFFALTELVLILGYGHRRDHIIIQKIREDFDKEGKIDAIFGKMFNAKGKNCCSFLPDFYNLFYWIFVIGQILVMLTMILLFVLMYCCGCKYYNICECAIGILAFLFFVVSVFCVVVSLYRRYHYFNKYENFSKKVEEQEPNKSNLTNEK